MAKSKKISKKVTSEKSETSPSKLSLFDHVKHIRSVQDPDYYTSLSEENRKTFSHFMILRALSMDATIVEEMALLYRYFDKIPSPQFYQLLIAIIPQNNRWVPWVKTKIVKHSTELVSLVASAYKVSKRQANEYINVLVATDDGLNKLVDLCQSNGLNDSEIEKIFDKKD